MGAVITLAIKDLRVLSRDRFALFWILAFPLMYVLFFGSIFASSSGGGTGAGISLALVDEDHSPASAALVARLAEHESLRVTMADDADSAGDPAAAGDANAPGDAAGEGDASGAGDAAAGSATADAVAARRPLLNSLDEARELVRKGQRTAYVRIPAGYGDEPWALFAGGAGGDVASLEVGVDPVRKAEAGFLQGILMEAQFAGLSQRFGDKDAMRGDIERSRQEIRASDDLGAGQKAVLDVFMGALGSFLDGIDPDVLAQGPMGGGGALEAPFELVEVSREPDQGPRSAFDVTLPQALVWGLMSVAISFAITLVRERTAGTLLRLRVAPINRAQLLAGKALACFFACLFVTSLLVVFGTLALGVRIDSVPLAALSAVCMSACFTGIMMTVSVMGRTEQAVAGASWGLMMPFAMLGGGMIPLIAMPPWLVTASNVSPFKWAIVSMEGAVWRGFDLADMALPCGVLLGIGALFFTIGVRVFRRMDG